MYIYIVGIMYNVVWKTKEKTKLPRQMIKHYNRYTIVWNTASRTRLCGYPHLTCMHGRHMFDWPIRTCSRWQLVEYPDTTEKYPDDPLWCVWKNPEKTQHAQHALWTWIEACHDMCDRVDTALDTCRARVFHMLASYPWWKQTLGSTSARGRGYNSIEWYSSTNVRGIIYI
jgi:hypothetical protein